MLGVEGIGSQALKFRHSGSMGGIRSFSRCLFREHTGTWRLWAMQARHRGGSRTGRLVISLRLGRCQDMAMTTDAIPKAKLSRIGFDQMNG